MSNIVAKITSSIDSIALSILDAIIEEHHTIDSIDNNELFEALELLENNLGDSDFTLEFDGNEYRIISEDAIWDIYVETIKDTVTECYDLKLDNIPNFIAFEIDWEQTAKNTYADGYGHTFSTYDGSELNVTGYYIFRTN